MAQGAEPAIRDAGCELSAVDMARVIWGTCGRLAAHHAGSRRDSGPHRVSCDPRVAPVGYSETRGRDELAQVTTAEEEDVVDHFAGWSDLGVAVVPSELKEFQQVKRSFGSLLSEHLSDTLPAFASALCTADGHAHSLHFASNRRVSEPAYCSMRPRGYARAIWDAWSS